MKVHVLARAWLVLVAAWFPATAFAETYYIDYDHGDDTAAGTRAAPWKRHPFMRGWAGGSRYTHQPGDRFIFRGGVTWPNDCFTMSITQGGDDRHEDYYGVDATWYAGSSFEQPHFDAQGRELAGGYDVMVLVPYTVSPAHFTIDNIDFVNLYWQGIKSYGWVAYLSLGTSRDVTIRNCRFRHWTHGTYPGTNDNMRCIYGPSNPPYNAGTLIENCLFDGETTTNSTQGSSSGEATYAYGGDIKHCTFRNLVSGPIITGDPDATTPQVIAYNEIGPTYFGFDPSVHPDGLQNNGGKVMHIHDNFVHDNHVMAFFIGNGAGAEQDFVWNNVIYDTPSHAPIAINTAYNGGRIYLWNNTLVSDSFPAVAVAYRETGGHLGLLDMRNNHIIGVGGTVWFEPGADVRSMVNEHNLLQSPSVAAAAGYNRANLFRPTGASPPTAEAGADLRALFAEIGESMPTDILGGARPAGARWDVGAYELGADVPVHDAGPPTSGADAGSPSRDDAGFGGDGGFLADAGVPGVDGGGPRGSDGGPSAATDASGSCSCGVVGARGATATESGFALISIAGAFLVARRRRARESQ